MTKEINYVSLADDRIFTSFFNNPDNIVFLEYLISALLGKEYEDVKGKIEILSRYIPIKDYIESNKQIDLEVIYDNNYVLNIEMNKRYYDGLIDRNVIYLSSMHVTNLKRRFKSYKEIGFAYQYNLNNFHYQNERLIESYYFKGPNGNILTDKVKVDMIDMTLAMQKDYTYNDKREELIGLWCQMFLAKDRLERNKRISGLMEDEKLRKEFIEKLDALSNEMHDHPLITKYGRFEMEQNTLIAEARDKGLADGKNMRNIEIAKNMIAMKMDIKTIAQVTGLTEQDIKKLNN